ncbi:hypothetical protein ERJ70_06340 [Sediminibacillus dalangtanensis]|uniref:Lipoprotein n=1 Tax=Sediminibacillus dalangtanensis TaxID=2729421 RepID=A0ABX7VQ17_9BACI|nr:hypothetical protein [Sediminibacillus dalangtanensis]QTM98954.1 hypothetical protein ERJ70_06340 [Sediminibacillus dalangtanensis]
MRNAIIYIPVIMTAVLAGCQSSSTAETHSEDNQIESQLELSVDAAIPAQISEKDEEERTKELNALYKMDEFGWGNSELPSMEFGLGSIHFQKLNRTEKDREANGLTTFFMDIQEKNGNTVLGQIVKAPEDRPEWKGKDASLEKTGETSAKLTIDGTASYTFTAFDNQELDTLYGDWKETESDETVTFTKGLTSNLHISIHNQEQVLAVNSRSEDTFSGVFLYQPDEEDKTFTSREVGLEIIDQTHVVVHSPEGVYKLEKEQ